MCLCLNILLKNLLNYEHLNLHYILDNHQIQILNFHNHPN